MGSTSPHPVKQTAAVPAAPHLCGNELILFNHCPMKLYVILNVNSSSCRVHPAVGNDGPVIVYPAFCHVVMIFEHMPPVSSLITFITNVSSAIHRHMPHACP